MSSRHFAVQPLDRVDEAQEKPAGTKRQHVSAAPPTIMIGMPIMIPILLLSTIPACRRQYVSERSERAASALRARALAAFEPLDGGGL